MCVSHSGADPVWHGGPSIHTVKSIRSLTRSREDTGRRFYVTAEGWKPLRGDAAFRELNNMIATIPWPDLHYNL